jgi:hypothetical protein
MARLVNKTKRSPQANGRTLQLEAARRLDVKPKYRSKLGNEETWIESPHIPGVRWEVKSGKQVPKFLTDAMDQVQSTRSIGSLWKPAVLLWPNDGGRVHAVLDLDDLLQLCKSLSEVGRGHVIDSSARIAIKELEHIREMARGGR